MRPIPAGLISVKQAWAFLVGCCLVSFGILVCLGWLAIGLGVASLALVAAYPFMKRITWWPQAWLGLVFTWGALVGWPAVTGEFAMPAMLLWLGSIFWAIGYDTLYAIQDIEDDALIGVKSSARALGKNARTGVGACYLLALFSWAAAIWSVRPDPLALVALVPAALYLAGQVVRTDPTDGARALALFRSNRFTGLLLFLGFLAVGLSSLD
jgi:4-hydroxybenzoate polyprenyltransferase